MRTLLVHRKLSMLERCPYGEVSVWRGVHMERCLYGEVSVWTGLTVSTGPFSDLH